jgi:hypothetical protein
MFDLNDDNLTRLKKDSPEDRLVIDQPAQKEGAENPLDGEKGVLLHGRLMAYYRQELDRQSANRFEQAMDEAYYDSEQWTEQEKAELRERGQAPIVWNVISTSVDWIIGSEKRGRTDFKVLPRGKEDAKPAEGKTKYLKYLSDVNDTPFNRSRAFEDAVKVGVGWMECSVQDEDDGEPIYDRYESWRNMLWDSSSTELDGSDMRYIFRSKWVDEDIALALVPNRRAAIASSVTVSTTYGSFNQQDGDYAMDAAEETLEDASISGAVTTHKRRRVRLIECWYRAPTAVKKMVGGPFSGVEVDEKNPEHVQAITGRITVVTTRMQMRVRVALLTPTALLFDGPSPFKHNRFKFIPIWGYRRGKDNLPYGVIRRMRDIQDDINKRASKAQYILSTNKVVMDEGAVDDIDEFADEVARPDAIIVKKAGKMLELNVDRDLAPAHLQLMSQGVQFIQTASGVTDELLGKTTNAVSGVAVEKRQEQGSLATTKFFDNLRLAEKYRGQICLSLVEQFVTDQKQFRITNQRGTPEFVTVNDGLPENDITRTQADYVISEADWRATMRQAATAELTELLVKMPPQVALVVLDLLVESMDIPNGEEIVKRIRAVNGQRDPDATELTPEEQQAMAEKQAAAAAQQQMFLAELKGKQADAIKKGAEADKATAGVKLIEAQTVEANMRAAQEAMTAATAVTTMPTIARVGDNLLKEGGWKGGQPVPVAAQGLPPLPMQQPPQQMPPQPNPPEQPAPQPAPEQAPV